MRVRNQFPDEPPDLPLFSEEVDLVSVLLSLGFEEPLPPGIVDSCNNAFVAQLKSPKDRDLMVAHLALSKKGFVDEQYKRYISRMPVARSIVKLGYSMDRRDVQPALVEPLMVPAREPTDAEIYRHFLGR